MIDVSLLLMFRIASLGFEETVITSPSGRPIYLDLQATTPTDPRVVEAMLPYFSQYFGNPHSRTHKYGWESEEAVEKARKVRCFGLSQLFKVADQNLLLSLSPT